VKRISHLASKDIRHENVLSVVRFTLASLSRSGLHEIRATKNGAADRLCLGAQRRTIAAEALVNKEG
jgi:hypothetical protein